MLRIGCVKYLNARPLVRGWPGDVDFDHPSALCERLAAGKLNVALVSSFEFLRNPIYRIVNDISISSDGPVYSVVVAHRGEFSEIQEIELDPASGTAVNLLHCLLAELEMSPRLLLKREFEKRAERNPLRSAQQTFGAGAASPPQDGFAMGTLPATHRARLLIGDQAIHFRQNHADEFRFWDLGEQWKNLIGLPFVYALWLVRPEVADPTQIASRLRALRDENLANLDGLIAAENVFDHEFCDRYYRNNLRFTFDEKEKEGLQTFAKLCEKDGLLSKHDLVFDLV